MCVPNLRCIAAQRIHRKMPNYRTVLVPQSIHCLLHAKDLTLQLAHPIHTISILQAAVMLAGDHKPGFRAEQSAQTLFPGIVLIKSCRARSLRACCLLLSVPDIVTVELLSFCYRSRGWRKECRSIVQDDAKDNRLGDLQL